MIEIKNVTKRFDDILALDKVSAKMEEGHVFGLIGTNGAGKSTLMRAICGVYRLDEGEILIDGEPVYDNPSVKSKVLYISDDQYYAGTTPIDMAKFMNDIYPNFNMDRFKSMMEILKLDINRNINTFSKGMKKQMSMLLGVSAGTKYLLCDETFDGLDPVMRQAVKKLLASEMDAGRLTPIITSHNLRELEDICETVGLLHKGGILFSKDLEEMKTGMFKMQVSFNAEEDVEKLKKAFEVIDEKKSGSLYTVTMRGMHEDIEKMVTSLNPRFYEMLPLSLEEIFIGETEVLGYDFSDLAN